MYDHFQLKCVLIAIKMGPTRENLFIKNKRHYEGISYVSSNNSMA